MSVSKPSSTSSSSSSPSTLSSLWDSYLHQLQTNPIRTKALTSAFTASIATVLAQKSLGVPLSNINWTAVKNQAIIGFLRGPMIHYWMEILTQLFNSLGFRGAAQAKPAVVLGKMVADQTIFAPFLMLWYMHTSGWLEGKPTAETSAKVAKDFWPLLQTNWKVWPLVSIINFKLIPPQLRVLTINIVGIFWTTYLVRAMAAAAAAAAAVKK